MMLREDGVCPLGEHTAWATPDGMKAEVRNASGRVVKRFKGETAHMDAVREAGDRN